MGELIEAFNALTPLGLAAGLTYVIYLLVRNQRKVQAITANHLHELPEMSNTLRRIETALNEQRDHLVYIRAKVGNGRP